MEGWNICYMVSEFLGSVMQELMWILDDTE